MNATVIARPAARRAAFGHIVRNEARLTWRQPAGMIAGIGISLGLLILFGELPVFRQTSSMTSWACFLVPTNRIFWPPATRSRT